jgi:hypothetical protein
MVDLGRRLFLSGSIGAATTVLLALPRPLAAQTAPPSAGPADPKHPEEARKAEATLAGTIPRPWELWKRKALAR